MAKAAEKNLAEAVGLMQAGKLDDAEALLSRVMQEQPEDDAIIHQAALLSWRRKRRKEAEGRFSRAVTLAPDKAGYRRNFCELLRQMQRLDEARSHGLAAAALAPDNADAWYNLALVHYDLQEIPEAIAAARHTLELDPKNPAAHFELAEALLLSGQFAEGWREYEWRFDIPGAPRLLPPHKSRQWDGGAMPDGTLMLIGDQGYGDTIQFCRFIPEAAKRCPNIIIAASPQMRPIVSQQKGITQYFDKWESVPAFDAYCPLSGLPRLFQIDAGNIPAAPYIKADPAKAAHWRARLEELTPPGYRRIGLAWAGRPEHGNDFNRSCSLEKLAPLFALEKTVFVSLQMGAARAEIGRYFGAAPLLNLAEDFSDTMGIMENLERVVTVDTSMGHLAAAMGRPTSILLSFAADWRWLMGRDDSPWYPSVTLHRQTRPGDWDSAVQNLLALLQGR